MAEFGLIASVVAVTGAALAASKALSNMIDQVRNAPEEIIAISRDTHSFRGIITNVQVAITDRFVVSKLQSEQEILQAVRQLEEPLKNCGTILKQMRSRIKSHLKQCDDGGFRVSSFDMRWIFQRKDVMDCRNRLETTKSTLNAALSSVVFLCHMKMMGSLGYNLDLLPISGLDVDAGSALREYAESLASRSPTLELDVDAGSALQDDVESIASRSPPFNAAFELKARLTQLPAQELSLSKQRSQEELRGVRSHAFKAADKSQTLLDAPNSDLNDYTASNQAKAIAPRNTRVTDLSKTKAEVTAFIKSEATAPSMTQTSAPSEAKPAGFRSAIDARDIGKIELMLAENDDVNISAADGWTALHVAAGYGRVDIVQSLIERNADVNGTLSRGLTPIHQATRNGHGDVVRILLNARNTDVNTMDSDGWTALHVAAYEGHDKVVQTLLKTKNIDVNAVKKDGKTSLHFAAYQGHKNIVQTLLKAKNIDVNAMDSDGWTALHFAAQEDHENIVQTLLHTKNIDINAADKYTRTSLRVAAYNGRENIVQTLLKAKNIDVNVMDSDELTALHVAASKGHDQIVHILLNAKDINVNAASLPTSSTPLHLAAEKGHEHIVEMLLDNKADTSAEDRFHKTALVAAIHAREEATAILLIQRGSPLRYTYNSSLCCACDEIYPRVVKMLIERGKLSGQLHAMLDDRPYGSRPLHSAALRGSLEIVSQLVEAGADLDVRNSLQETPLISASWAGHSQIMDYLIAHGADRAAKDYKRQNYLQVLKERQPDKYEEHVRNLKSNPHVIRRKPQGK